MAPSPDSYTHAVHRWTLQALIVIQGKALKKLVVGEGSILMLICS